MSKERSEQLGTRRSLFWRLWLRSLTVKRPQAALAISALLVGAAVASMLLNLYGDVRRKMTQEFRAFGANVVVAPAAASSASGDLAGLMEHDVINRLEAHRQQRRGIAAVPLLYVVMRLIPLSLDPRLPEFQNLVTVGADFAALRQLYPGWRVEGGGGTLDDGACAVGARVAARWRLRVGDSLELESVRPPTGRVESKRRAYRIASVLSTGASEDDQVFISLASLQTLAGFEGKISMVELRVPGETPEVELGVRELSGALPGLEVRPLRQIVYSEGKVLDTIRGLLLSLTVLILAIIGLCVMATMTAIVLERRKDIAVMKALGASDPLVMRLFLSEGAGLGLLGGFAGFFLGGYLAREVAGRLFGITLNLVWWTFPLVCLASMLLAVLAALFPVRMVRRVQPAVVLKGQ